MCYCQLTGRGFDSRHLHQFEIEDSSSLYITSIGDYNGEETNNLHREQHGIISYGDRKASFHDLGYIYCREASILRIGKIGVFDFN